METILTIGFVVLILLIIVLEVFSTRRREKRLVERLDNEQAEANRIFKSGDVYGACEYLAEHSNRG